MASNKISRNINKKENIIHIRRKTEVIRNGSRNDRSDMTKTATVHKGRDAHVRVACIHIQTQTQKEMHVLRIRKTEY